MTDKTWTPLGEAVERVIWRISGHRSIPLVRPNVGRFLPSHEARSLADVIEQINEIKRSKWWDEGSK